MATAIPPAVAAAIQDRVAKERSAAKSEDPETPAEEGASAIDARELLYYMSSLLRAKRVGSFMNRRALIQIVDLHTFLRTHLESYRRRCCLEGIPSIDDSEQVRAHATHRRCNTNGMSHPGPGHHRAVAIACTLATL